MATNPMKRRARNSFLIGVLLTMIIAAAVVAYMYLQLEEAKKQKKEVEIAYDTAYVVDTEIKSGASLKDCFSNKSIPAESIPKNALKPEDIKNYTKVEDGESVTADEIPSCLDETVISKINLEPGTILTKDMLALQYKLSKDMRVQEYNMISLPVGLAVDDYIDIRLQLPTGEDFIVVSKKRVINTDATTVWVEMAEQETLVMSNAIVEAYIMTGSKLYATIYVEPGMQEQASLTYVPSDRVATLIDSDLNITSEARTALINEYKEGLKNIRHSQIQSNLDLYAEEALENINQGVKEEITNRQQARQDYIQALEAGSTSTTTAE